MTHRLIMLGLSVALTALPAVATPVVAEMTANEPVLVTLDAPDAVIGDDRRTLSGAMDSATIARTAQQVAAAIEAAGGTASIPSYRFPYVLAALPAGFDVSAISGVRSVSESPKIALALNTALDTAQVSDLTPALTLGSPNTQVLRGKGQNIAILDSGVDANHPFSQDSDGISRVIAEACFVTLPLPGGGTDCPTSSGAGASHPLPNNESQSPTAANSHGMHVAGIAAGSRPQTTNPSRGVASEAGIISVRIFPVESRQGQIVDLIAALEWLLQWVDDNAGTPNARVAAVNLSLGFGCSGPAPNADVSKDVYDLIEALRRKGAVTVAATGNSAQRTSIDAPSCYNNTIAVTATEGTDDSEAIASYANVSSDVDVAAPGTGIASSAVLDSYGILSGTSMAAPMVAGAVALLREAAPDLADDDFFAAAKASFSTGPMIDDERPIVVDDPNVEGNTARPAGTVTGMPRLRAPDTIVKLRDDGVSLLNDVPTAPTSLTVSAAETQATVSFGLPTTVPGSVTGYTVTAVDTATDTTVATCVRGLRQSRSCTITGLTTGATYRFAVTATNLFGASLAAQSDAVTLQAPPPPPPPPPPPTPPTARPAT